MMPITVTLAVAAALTMSLMFLFEIRSSNVGKVRPKWKLAISQRKGEPQRRRTEGRKGIRGCKNQKTTPSLRRDMEAIANGWKCKLSPKYLKSEMIRVIDLRNRKVLSILRRMKRHSSPNNSWSKISINVKGLNYLLLLGWENSINRDFGRWKEARQLSSIRKHPGKRCILVDIRTQSTMLACTPEGKVVVNYINSVMLRLFREARVKLWEPIILTYETSDLHKMYMLRVLESHIMENEEETWRSILSTVRRHSKVSAEQGKIYNPKMSVVVRDPSTSYKEALCRDSVQFVFGENCKIKRVRPVWLKSPHSRYSLELDVFCESENLAVEYNGKQHYMFDRESKMKARIEKDLSKLIQTRERRVNLIIVPYLISDRDIRRYIILSIACNSY